MGWVWFLYLLFAHICTSLHIFAHPSIHPSIHILDIHTYLFIYLFVHCSESSEVSPKGVETGDTEKEGTERGMENGQRRETKLN
ncbi:uncharacterized protein C8R40DRAFT_792677 [Lentinula edodes]|uniref:uncharacterized protein n=1 Tax=Lentinula edodes TaxID=5353 RepID=UPI001E8E5905|nr:uncharacterized protein C8R40DRAFT_792677 [Lentinula edodes]KAH7869032.1 hypothetical protein C8R40DRAFT_792677 [Lentinula edodes]